MKKWYLSKTLWVNALVLVVTFLGFFPDSKLALEGLAVANLALRVVTNQALGK